MRPEDSRSMYRMKQILDLLLDGDRDQAQITQGICMTDPRRVADYLKYLASKNKIHCCGWRDPKPNGHRWPVYRFGKGRNVPKPKPKTQAEIMRAYWRRQGRSSLQQPRDPRPVASPFAALGL